MIIEIVTYIGICIVGVYITMKADEGQQRKLDLIEDEFYRRYGWRFELDE